MIGTTSDPFGPAVRASSLAHQPPQRICAEAVEVRPNAERGLVLTLLPRSGYSNVPLRRQICGQISTIRYECSAVTHLIQVKRGYNCFKAVWRHCEAASSSITSQQIYSNGLYFDERFHKSLSSSTERAIPPAAPQDEWLRGSIGFIVDCTQTAHCGPRARWPYVLLPLAAAFSSGHGYFRQLTGGAHSKGRCLARPGSTDLSAHTQDYRNATSRIISDGFCVDLRARICPCNSSPETQKLCKFALRTIAQNKRESPLALKSSRFKPLQFKFKLIIGLKPVQDSNILDAGIARVQPAPPESPQISNLSIQRPQILSYCKLTLRISARASIQPKRIPFVLNAPPGLNPLS
ncbi:hypothetical protein B0H15DRAFT_805204 [Mycena belliarum]|uniref:Uncharacterized protein n=1 Tax=Mycena belliarum TaxID=1033014 RepID=A0AAD6TRY6_9AGAR|nr:hypothetical protein B0H15DRAFT_805204 [Mycena belliae]